MKKLENYLDISENKEELVFPEMLGTEEIVEQMSRELDMRSGVCNSDSPCLTMCPSVWQENRNYCKILDDMGDMICEQQKHHGVEMKKPAAKEDIKSDKKIYILHGYGIGRIAVAICKDFLVTKYLRILAEKLRVNLILVPSFTARNYHFKILAAKYADLDCNVIWVNTCSARWLNENSEIENPVLLSCQPGKRGVKSEGVNMEDICGHPCRCMNSDTRRQACVQSGLQMVRQKDIDNLDSMLKGYRRLRRTMAGLPKEEREEMFYECGIFNGMYKVFEEINIFFVDQERHRNTQKVLGRKHVPEILDYLIRELERAHESAIP